MSDTPFPRGCCGLALQVCDEVFWRYISLAEQACQCADLGFNFTVVNCGRPWGPLQDAEQWPRKGIGPTQGVKPLKVRTAALLDA